MDAKIWFLIFFSVIGASKTKFNVTLAWYFWENKLNDLKYLNNNIQVVFEFLNLLDSANCAGTV